MANAMPMAIGAQMEYPERQVIALCGDGGLSMLLGDLITIVQYRLPVKSWCITMTVWISSNWKCRRPG